MSQRSESFEIVHADEEVFRTPDHAYRKFLYFTPPLLKCRPFFNGGFMYVSAWIAWWRPGGSTCLSAAAVAVRGRTGSERGRVGEYSELDKPKTDLRDKDTSLRR